MSRNVSEYMVKKKDQWCGSIWTYFPHSVWAFSYLFVVVFARFTFLLVFVVVSGSSGTKHGNGHLWLIYSPKTFPDGSRVKKRSSPAQQASIAARWCPVATRPKPKQPIATRDSCIAARICPLINHRGAMMPDRDAIISWPGTIFSLLGINT